MSSYQQYNVPDFAMDPSFREWVLSPTAESTLFWETWLREHPAKREAIQKARHLLLAVNAEARQAPSEAVQRMWQVIAEETAEPEESPRVLNRRKWLPISFRVAASWLFLLLIAGGSYYWLHASSEQRYATQYGQIQKVTLPDGSVVTLNANSTLSFDPDWEKASSREVKLDGEAFFAVQEKTTVLNGKAVRMKFIVHTPDMGVEVLGTQFNVAHRHHQTTVVLRSGKVKLDLAGESETKSVLMKPGDLVSYSSEQKKLVKQLVNPDVLDAWKESRWVFRNSSLEEVAFKIEETYGLQMVWQKEALKKRTVSGVVPTNDLTALLQALSLSLNLQITKKGDQLLIQE